MFSGRVGRGQKVKIQSVVVIALSWRWLVGGDDFPGARQLGLLNFPGCPWLVEDGSYNFLAGLKPAARRLLTLCSKTWGPSPQTPLRV